MCHGLYLFQLFGIIILLNDEKKFLRLSVDTKSLKEDAIYFEDAVFFQDFGLYSPRYNFISADEYKVNLDKIRLRQKEMIKNDTAIAGAKNWTVDGSKSKGSKMIKDMKNFFLELLIAIARM